MFAQYRSWNTSSMAQKLHREQQARISRLKASGPAASSTVAEQTPPTHREPVDPWDHDDGQDSDTLFSRPSSDVDASDPDYTPSKERRGAVHRRGKRPDTTPRSTTGDVTPSSRVDWEKARDSAPGRKAAAQREDRDERMRRRNQFRSKDLATSELDGARRKRSRLPDSDRPRDKSPSRRTQATEPQPRGQVSHSKEHPGPRGNEVQADSVVCEWCGKELCNMTKLYCRDCPFRFCLDCAANAGVLYPGHKSTHRCGEIPPRGGPASRAVTKAPGPDESDGHPACALCGKELRDIRYKCRQCTDFYLCGDHCKLHFAGHVVEPQGCPDRTAASSGNRDAQTNGQPSVGGGYRGRGRMASAWSETSASEDGTDDDKDDDVDDDVDNQTDSDGVDGTGDAENHNGRDEAEEEERDDDSWNGESSTSPGRRRRLPQPPSPGAPKEVTITMPMEGYLVFKSWAEAILAQSPAMESSLGQPAKKRRPGSGNRSRRPWLPEDRRELRRLKEQGHDFEEVARIIGRSPGAVAQQWRKQK